MPTAPDYLPIIVLSCRQILESSRGALVLSSIVSVFALLFRLFYEKAKNASV